MFFQKQLGILLLPFISVVFCALFWLLYHAYNLVDPVENRRLRKKRNQERFKRKKLNGLDQLSMKKLNRLMAKRKKRSKKIMSARASKAQKKEKQSIAKDLLCIQVVFQLVEKTEDGKVSKSEMTEALVRRRVVEPKLDRALQELEQRFPAMKPLLQSDTASETLIAIPTSKEGVLTKHEMLSYCKNVGKEEEKDKEIHNEESASVKTHNVGQNKPSGWEAAKFFDEEIFEEIFDEQAIKKNWKKMTDDERKEAVETRWKHLRATAVDNEVDNGDQKDKIEIDGLNEPVQVIQFVVHPLVNPLGIVWVI